MLNKLIEKQKTQGLLQKKKQKRGLFLKTSAMLLTVIILAGMFIGPNAEAPVFAGARRPLPVSGTTESTIEVKEVIAPAKPDQKPIQDQTTEPITEAIPSAIPARPSNPSQLKTTPAPNTHNENLIVHFLDVGQGDATFIQLPNGQVILVDGGESYDASSIKKYLKSNGITKIDYLVITHPHADHIGGLPTIIDMMEIGSVYMPRVSHTTQTFEKLLTSIQKKGLQIDTAKAGVSILSTPELQIDVIAPIKSSYSNLNNYSAVIKITYGSTAFLFMGDAESLSEGQIKANVFADVIKVGHHGSDTSTSATFLKKVSPSYAIISVGKGNSYGHPKISVLSRLNDAGVETYRTDLQGTIVFSSDGNTITVNKELIPYEDAQPIESSDEPEPEQVKKTVYVWLSATGKKYHRINNCGNMNPKKARKVTLAQAKKSYKPCSNCKPPR